MAKNTNMSAAKKAKNDEFYTRLNDIAREMVHYREHFKNKTVLLNCDDYRDSQFFRFFTLQFEMLELKKLIATGYKEDGKGVVCTYEGHGRPEPGGMPDESKMIVSELQGNGGFESEECVELMREADIVVTNPPFSKFRDYVAQLIDMEKKFLIIGNNNAIPCKEIFPLIKENKLWLGIYAVKSFIVPDNYEAKNVVVEDGIKVAKFGNICWFTNLTHKKRNLEQILYRKYYGNEDKYPKYDNYDAIEVSKVKDIPEDYFGVMGVPITFLSSYNSNQFEILGSQQWSKGIELEQIYTGNKESVHDDKSTLIKGKETYSRIFIKRKMSPNKKEINNMLNFIDECEP